ncbi:MAG: 3-dehydroquinate synthase [Peptococcaceae bacterium]|nr:3-dehydroquinate synthase [Peptococcaceae bacterium]
MSGTTVDVATGHPYKVHIDHGLLDSIGQRLTEVHKPCTAVILSDSTVAPLYLERLKKSVTAAGFSVLESVVPAGEESKSFAVLEKLVNDWSLAGLHRDGLVIALGGGVVGDLGGFAASCYMRGIPFVQVPTTLLAAVDSSVGGKTAIDIASGKNLVGAFYQPLAVYCDVDLIATMAEAAFADGVAETIKYGVLHHPALFARLGETALVKDAADLDEIVDICVRYKNKIVSDDEFEKGSRQLLNLGHTFAHAIEHLSAFETTHGHAVAIGLAMMARAAARKGWTTTDVAAQIEAVLATNHLPTTTDYDAGAMCDVCRRDKKAAADSITIVVPEAIGRCVLKKVSYDDLLELIKLGKEPL